MKKKVDFFLFQNVEKEKVVKRKIYIYDKGQKDQLRL